MTPNPDHLERTAAEPRDKSLHTVVLQHVEEVNDTTRVFHLGIPRDAAPIHFLPGQWLDVYLPGVEKAGGFTITSTPREARLAHPPIEAAQHAGATPSGDNNDSKGEDSKLPPGPFLELAVQKSPENPPAAWLWQEPRSALIGRELRVRVGGGFVWPPPGINVRSLRRVVFVAGGLGVNPLVSMICSLASSASSPPVSATPASATTIGGGLEVRFLYSAKDPGVGVGMDGSEGKGEGDGKGSAGRRSDQNILFLERIARVFHQGCVKGRLEVFLTGGGDSTGDIAEVDRDEGKEEGGNEIVVAREKEDTGTTADDDGNGNDKGKKKGDFTIPFHPRRCTVEDDVATAVGNPRFAVVYVCGVPTMTDDFVTKLTAPQDAGGLGMEAHRVLCEKWW